LDKDNIVNFPNNEPESDSEEHICDGCTSYAIHRLTHNFQETDHEFAVESYLDRIFSCLEEESPEGLVGAVIEMWHDAYHQGQVDVMKEQLHRSSAILSAMTNSSDGDTQ
jgi:hypothetical protein